MIEGKGLGGKKVNRVNVSLSNSFNRKLTQLATACNMRPTTLAGVLVERCLDSADVIADLQKEYCLHSAYKIMPVKKGNELVYLLNDNRREDFR
ncbi:hypothetical protein [Bacillus sp. B-jedd]|uniref:hypothetical protein n=1 Tax=Bacillus sp. B-jedd TaxID=1476857 RepID=UPI00051571B6|nr:hypothetical protein [Bacillus sp. B-jedd]CEG28060.1 hypothetical protein BN1002_02939 [Bacillus sp. B-jedd]